MSAVDKQANIQSQVKKKINELRDELDKTKELLDKANQVAEEEKKAREQVPSRVMSVGGDC